MLAADTARALVIGGLALLSVTGHLDFWELVVIVALYGVGTAFFTPAFEASSRTSSQRPISRRPTHLTNSSGRSRSVWPARH